MYVAYRIIFYIQNTLASNRFLISLSFTSANIYTSSLISNIKYHTIDNRKERVNHLERED